MHLYIGGRPDASSSLGTDRFATTLNGGAVFPSATTLWGNTSKMLGYDIMLLSCEGSQYADVKMPFYGNVKKYADSGGRIFAEPPALQLAVEGPGAVAEHGGLHRRLEEDNDPPNPVTATVDATFPKGAALADWLVARRRDPDARPDTAL